MHVRTRALMSLAAVVAVVSAWLVSIALPAWLSDSVDVAVSEVRGGVAAPVAATRSKDVVTATIPSLTVGTIPVVQPAP